MSAVHFSGSASAIDRRRRRLVTEIDHEFDLSGTAGATTLHNCGGEIAPFPMLSRDRLIRRVISPRLWKHVTVAIVLILIPLIYGFVTLRSLDDTPIADQVLWASRVNASRGLSGLALFCGSTVLSCHCVGTFSQRPSIFAVPIVGGVGWRSVCLLRR